MTAAAQRNGSSRYYGLTYQSDAVGGDAKAWLELGTLTQSESSVTVEQKQARLFSQIVAARSESEEAVRRGDAEREVSREAVNAAIDLLHALPGNLPEPDIVAEEDGDIAFEWCRDRRHVAVLFVDGQSIRWSSVFGVAASTSGSEAFSKSVPGLALQAICAALD